MTAPVVTFTVLDGTQGIQASGPKYLVVVGPSTLGTANVPTPVARVKSLTTAFGTGPGPEFAAYAIEQYGLKILYVKSAANVAGTVGTIDVTGVTGTAVVAVQAGSAPTDDRDVWVRVETGGTRGTAGITYRISYDGGQNYSPLYSLGTDIIITVPSSEVGTLVFTIAAGTLVAGDTWKLRTNAPTSNAADLTAALTGLAGSSLPWKLALIATPMDATITAAVDTKFAALRQLGKDCHWVQNFRMPNPAETEAQYLTAFAAVRAAITSIYGNVCAGAADISSSITGRMYRRPISCAIGAREASVDESTNIAEPDLGALPGVVLKDVNGNPKHHDETNDPGLDDQFATTLKTFDGLAGVYVTRSRIFSPDGSDFRLMVHRKVMDLAMSTARAYFNRRLSKPVAIDKSTGFILEGEAKSIERRATAALETALKAKPHVSDVTCVVARDDNLLSTSTMTVEIRLIPLGYPENIAITIGFLNPALRTAA